MKAIRFNAPILSGHKSAAVEVPFDPGTKWQTSAQQLQPGRRGHLAHATLNGAKFDSAIVARSRRFWLLVDDAVLTAAKAEVGEIVDVTVAPLK
jgi:Domain of unknown function (DUF1905)